MGTLQFKQFDALKVDDRIYVSYRLWYIEYINKMKGFMVLHTIGGYKGSPPSFGGKSAIGGDNLVRVSDIDRNTVYLVDRILARDSQQTER